MYFPSSKKLERSDKFYELKRLSEGHLQLFLNQVVGKMIRWLILWLVSSCRRVIDIRIFFSYSSLRGGGGKGFNEALEALFQGQNGSSERTINALNFVKLAVL